MLASPLPVHSIVLVIMYRKQGQPTISPQDFKMSSEENLSEDNRWVIMASFMPWAEFEDEYSSSFSIEMGAPAKPFRMALGALIIKEKLGIREARNGRANKGKPLSTILYRDVIL